MRKAALSTASQENCCLRSEMRTPISAAAEMGAFCFSASDARGVSPFTGKPKIEKTAFVATARPGETRTRRSCSLAEQGNRVQVPDMGPEPAGFRFRSCDCGASPCSRAETRGLRKRVIGTAVMAGREGRDERVGGCPPERISQKTYTSVNHRGRMPLWSMFVSTGAVTAVAALLCIQNDEEGTQKG